MRMDRLEMADGSALFLDEIEELPLAIQILSLHLRQEKAFERLGGIETIKVDVRIISTPSCAIEARINIFQCRLDLYDRLNLFPIFVPPLRERRTGIMFPADYFIKRIAKKRGQHIGRISAPVRSVQL
jgi:Nif-specific regulatory protein